MVFFPRHLGNSNHTAVSVNINHQFKEYAINIRTVILVNRDITSEPARSTVTAHLYINSRLMIIEYLYARN